MKSSLNNKEDCVIGIAKTHRQGSQVEFKICPRKEWDALTEDGKYERMIEAMWESESVSVFTKEYNGDKDTDKTNK